MGLCDRLNHAIEAVLQQDPAAYRAINEGVDAGRGEAAHAVRDLMVARNALLDAAARWDQAHDHTDGTD